MKTTFIYALCCPLSGEIRYIGKSNNPKGRFTKHKSKNSKDNNLDKKEWIKNLLSNNLLPVLKILEEVSIEEWKNKEKFYIKEYKNNGCNLLNICGGANGSEFGNITSFNGRNAVKIVCLDKEGNYINTFDSIKKGTEFCGHKIYNALKRNTKSTGNYLWLYEKEYNELSEIELKKFIENANINNSSKNGEKTRFGNIPAWNSGKNDDKNVYQYTIEGTFLKKWNNVKEAIIYLNISEKYAPLITRCISGKRKTAYGYKWYYNKIVQ